MAILKVLTWNIQAGGGKRISMIAEALLQEQADLLVLTEFRHETGQGLVDSLHRAGYVHIHASQPDIPRENVVMVAAKLPFYLLENKSFGQDPQRGVVIHLPAWKLNVLAVHIPGAPDHKFVDGYGISGQQRKTLFWDQLLEHSHALLQQHTLLIGDFNTGLPEDAEGMPFRLKEKMKSLLAQGYFDAWRTLHGSQREYTWYSRQKIDGISQDKNGFRLDYQFCSPSLAKQLLTAHHRHDVRHDRLSDHAMLICTFGDAAAT